MTMIGPIVSLAAFLLLQAGPSSSFSNPRFLLPSPRTTSSSRRRAASNDEEPHSSSSPVDILRELRARVDRQRHQYARLEAAQATYADEERELPEAVHIVLFHVDTPQQHVHTIDVGHQELMLAFESGAECLEFVRVLQDSKCVDPSPAETTSGTILSKHNTQQKRSASFCSTHTPQRHVHVIDVGHQERIVAFESRAECVEFCENLRDLEFTDPSPVETMLAPFAQFCTVADTAMLIVPTGFGLTPPQINTDGDGDEGDNGFVDAVDGDGGTRLDAKDYAASARRKRWTFLDDDDDGLVAWG